MDPNAQSVQDRINSSPAVQAALQRYNAAVQAGLAKYQGNFWRNAQDPDVLAAAADLQAAMSAERIEIPHDYQMDPNTGRVTRDSFMERNGWIVPAAIGTAWGIGTFGPGGLLSQGGGAGGGSATAANAGAAGGSSPAYGPLAGGYGAATPSATVPTSLAAPSGAAAGTGVAGGVGASILQGVRRLAPATGSLVGGALAGQAAFGGGTPTQAPIPPELTELLRMSLQRVRDQEPLFQSITAQARGGLPTAYQRNGGGQ